jgi:hypothetical protein
VSTSYPYLKVGKPDVKPDAPSHTPGIKMGNAEGNYKKQKGHLPDGSVTAERSTGVNPARRDPIAPQVMPNLPPG